MKPELLAPAGSPESLRAAVLCGADAVYLGWGDFNARRNAKNFTDEEFADALLFCHQRGVRVFLTLNTLLTDRELPRALETARQACRLGIDAVLIQDWGLFTLLRQALPDLPLHASTQMSIFTSGGACEAAAMGCERVVIARECSAEDTASICKNCPAEIEIFFHGALCMCYSGQCSMSALIGGRSGNRGKCAQPCRLPYGVDEKAGGYPLSLKDSCLADRLQEAADMGVACLKLEGRMKRPEYVAVITGIYSRLLEEGRRPTAAEKDALEQAFSRSGFTDWYWQGKKGPGMFGTRPENAPDPKELFAAARAAYEKESTRTVPVRFTCRAIADKAITLTAADHDGHAVTVSGPVPEAARNRAVTAEDVAARLSKTGGTAYHCESADVTVDDGLSLSAAVINALRRDALTALTEARTAVPVRRELPAPNPPEDTCAADKPQLTVSVTFMEQLSPELLAMSPAVVYVPLEVLSHVTALPAYDGIWCAVLPRIWKDADEPLLRRWLEHAKSLGITAAALSNLGHLSLVRNTGLAMYGDLGLNVFNARSADFLRSKGLNSACLSFELRGAQIRDMAKPLPAEAVVYGRLPLMIMENCLVKNKTGCKLDRNGSAVPACGPCRSTHTLHDRTGARFPLLPAFGHRTEIQNCKPMYLADRADWKQLGLTYARLRFTTETAEECAAIFRAYRDGAPAAGDYTRGLFDRGVE